MKTVFCGLFLIKIITFPLAHCAPRRWTSHLNFTSDNHWHPLSCCCCVSVKGYRSEVVNWRTTLWIWNTFQSIERFKFKFLKKKSKGDNQTLHFSNPSFQMRTSSASVAELCCSLSILYAFVWINSFFRWLIKLKTSYQEAFTKCFIVIYSLCTHLWTVDVACSKNKSC